MRNTPVFEELIPEEGDISACTMLSDTSTALQALVIELGAIVAN